MAQSIIAAKAQIGQILCAKNVNLRSLKLQISVIISSDISFGRLLILFFRGIEAKKIELGWESKVV